jgi:hypothetical protein
MVEAELVQGRSQANPATNSVGCTYGTIHNRSYKDTSTAEYPIHQLQQDGGKDWIVLGENDRVNDPTNSYFKVIRQPNGDIYLKLIDIFRHKEEAAGSDYQANPADDSADSSPNYHHHEHE